MSRAFIREDVDPPERSGRVRSAAGLPPGATNYISARGARRLREELDRAHSNGDRERAAELEAILRSVTVVDPPEPVSKDVSFGATATVAGTDGATRTYTVVGVDELAFDPDGVSWISPIGKSLLAGKVGESLIVDEKKLGKIVKVEYRG